MKKLRARDSQATQETHVVPPLAAFVPTLTKAVELSLANGVHEKVLFNLARMLKAFEITSGVSLTPTDLQNAFSLWWVTAAAMPDFPPDAYQDEFRFEFEAAFAKVRAPWGADPLQEAIECAQRQPAVVHADRYTSPKLKRLVAVCYHLQLLCGDAPFFLGLRDASAIAGIPLSKMSAMMGGLVGDKVITQIEKGVQGGHKATRYRFNFSDLPPLPGQTKAPK